MKALIVLGGGITDDEQLNEHTRLRYEKALKIYKKYDLIICSAGKTYRDVGKQRLTEAEVGKRFLVKNGVTTKIVLEDVSKDTFSNAYYCRKILDKLKIKEFSVVTSRFHMAKTKYVFKLVFPQKIKFITSSNGKISKLALRNRKISERLVLQFYKKHLKKTYGIKKGDMKSIENFLKNFNLATSGKMDSYQEALTNKIESKIDKRSPLLY